MSSASKSTKSKTPAKEPRVPAHVHSAFAKFEEANRAYHLFVEKNLKVVDQYNLHRDNYNSSLSEVKALYKQYHKALGDSFGGFFVRMQRELDSDMLRALYPAAEEHMKVTYSLTIGELEKLLAEDIIPEDVAEQVVSEKIKSINGHSELK